MMMVVIVVQGTLVISVNFRISAAVAVVLVVFLLLARTSTFSATTAALGGRSAGVSTGISAADVGRAGGGIEVCAGCVVVVVFLIVVVVVIRIACTAST